MGVPVLILGASGSGKSASLRNFDPAEVGVFNVASKPLPFRKKLKLVNGNNYDGKKFETARVRLSWRSSESVEVNGIDALPDEYLRFKDPEPDKTKIKAALKAGVELKGCMLVAKQNLQIK